MDSFLLHSSIGMDESNGNAPTNSYPRTNLKTTHPGIEFSGGLLLHFREVVTR